MRLDVLICRKRYPCGALEALDTPASAVEGSLGLDRTWRGSLRKAENGAGAVE